jgi:hypothetical protein
MIAITVFSFPSRLVIDGCATDMRPKYVAERVSVSYLETLVVALKSTENLCDVRVAIHLPDTEIVKHIYASNIAYEIIITHRIKYVADRAVLNYLDSSIFAYHLHAW